MTRAKRHKSRLLFLVSFIFLLLVLGCGRKGPPVAPQAVVPPAVKDLKAEIMADDVGLTWSIPKRDDTIKANYMGYLQLSRRNP